MQYLINKNKEDGKAHIWDWGLDGDGDTFCKMYSTGGLAKKKYTVVNELGDREVCSLCRAVWREIYSLE